MWVRYRAKTGLAFINLGSLVLGNSSILLVDVRITEFATFLGRYTCCRVNEDF
jgi:hypothetical protein